MPRSARDSDDEPETRTGRKTRTIPGLSAIESPLRRSTRIRQPTNKQTESSPDSPVNDGDNVQALPRAPRRRTDSLDSQTQSRWKTLKNSGSIDIPEEPAEINIVDTPTKRNTRRSLADISSLDVTKGNTRSNKRNTRAGSEAKTSPPVRTTRKTRASSVGLESIQDFKGKERLEVERIDTSLRTRRKAFMAPSRSPVAEETEQKQSIPYVELEKILSVVEETCASDELVDTENPHERPQATNKKLNDKPDKSGENPMKEEKDPIKGPSNDIPINVVSKSSNSGDAVTNDTKLSQILEKELENSTAESDSCLMEIESAVHDASTKSTTARDGSPEVSKIIVLKSGSLMDRSIKEQEKSPGNKENQCANIITATSFQQNKEITAANVTLSPKSFSHSFVHKETKEKANVSVDDVCSLATSSSTEEEEAAVGKSITIVKEIDRSAGNKKHDCLGTDQKPDAELLNDSTKMQDTSLENIQSRTRKQVDPLNDSLNDPSKDQSGRTKENINSSALDRLEDVEEESKEVVAELVDLTNETHDNVDTDSADIDMRERTDNRTEDSFVSSEIGNDSITSTLGQMETKSGLKPETKKVRKDCQDEDEKIEGDQSIIVSDNEKFRKHIEAVSVSQSDAEINASIELTESDSMTLKMSDSNTTDISVLPSDKADEKRLDADMEDQCSIGSNDCSDESMMSTATTITNVTKTTTQTPSKSIVNDKRSSVTVNEAQSETCCVVKIDQLSAVTDSQKEVTKDVSKREEFEEKSSARQSIDKKNIPTEESDLKRTRREPSLKSEESLTGDEKDDSDTNIGHLFQDIPADEWKQKKDSKKKHTESEISSVHSMSTERLENESEAECDFILVDKEAWLAAETLKTTKEKETSFDYDSDDTVILKSHSDSLIAQEEDPNVVTIAEDGKVDVDTDLKNSSRHQRNVSFKNDAGTTEIRSNEGKLTKRKVEGGYIVNASRLNKSGPASPSRHNISSHLSGISSNRRLSAPGTILSAELQSATRKEKNSAADELNQDSGSTKRNLSQENTSLDRSKVESVKSDDRSMSKQNKTWTDTSTKESGNTPCSSIAPHSESELVSRRSLNKPKIIDSSESEDVEMKDLECHASENSSINNERNYRRTLKTPLSQKKKKSIDSKYGEVTKTSAFCPADGEDTSGDANQGSADSSDTNKGKTSMKNYSTVAYVDSNSEDKDGENVDTDSSEDKKGSVEKPGSLYAGAGSESDDDRDTEASSNKSIDSDIVREYNLHGKAFLEYSDDEVPGDECRASETESSDSQDNGSDLADFVVDDDESEEESNEEGEDREANEKVDEEEEDEHEDDGGDIENVDTLVSEEKPSRFKGRVPRILDSDEEEKDEKATDNAKLNCTSDTTNTIDLSSKKRGAERKREKSRQSAGGTDKNSFGHLNESEMMFEFSRKVRKLNVSLECSTPKGNVHKYEGSDEILSTSAIISESESKKSRAHIAPDKMSVTKNSSTHAVTEKEENLRKSTTSVKNESISSRRDHSANAAELSYTKKQHIKSTIELAEETPTRKFLKKQKLHESLPALIMDDRSMILKQQNHNQKRTEELSSEESAIASDNLPSSDEHKMANSSRSSVVNEQRRKKQKRRVVPIDMTEDDAEKAEKTMNIIESVEDAPLDIDNSSEKKKSSKKKRKLIEVQMEKLMNEPETSVNAINAVEVPRKKNQKRKTKKEISDKLKDSENNVARVTENLKKGSRKHGKIPQELPNERRRIGNKLDRKVSRTPVDLGTLSNSNEAALSVAFSKTRDEALESIKRVTESIKAERTGQKRKDKGHSGAMKIREGKKESIIALDASKKLLKRLPEEDLEKLSDVPLRPKKKQKLCRSILDDEQSQQKRRQPVTSRSVIASGMIKTSTADARRQDGSYCNRVSSLSSHGGTTQFNVVNLQKVKKRPKKQPPSITLFRQAMLSRNARHPVSAYLMYIQKQKASSTEN